MGASWEMQPSLHVVGLLRKLAPSSADPAVARVIADNSTNKTANRISLGQLPPTERATARFRSVVTLCIIAWTFWVSVVGTAMLWVWHVIRSGTTADVDQAAYEQVAAAGHKKTAIVTGGKMTKALHICRHLHASGWRVVLVETHKYWHVGARFSKAVDAFHTVPIPEDDPVAYLMALRSIAVREDASLFIPTSSPIASVYDALVAEALPDTCRSVCLPAPVTALLDNKVAFSKYATQLGLLVPRHFEITSPRQLLELNATPQVFEGQQFLLKNLSYDPAHRSDMVVLPCPDGELRTYLDRPDVVVSETQPWMLQQLLKGPEFSCYTIAHNGRVVAHADTSASVSNLNYKNVGRQDINDWVDAFCTRSGASGQLCFDFMHNMSDGQLYCIECNPRTSTVITEFHDHPSLAAAFTDPKSVKGVLRPLSGSKPTYWFWNEVARLATTGNILQFLSTIFQGVDAVWDPTDPLPFLALHYIQIPVLLMYNIRYGNPWNKIDLCIGKISELYGD